MEISIEELQKLLDKTWDKGLSHYCSYWQPHRVLKDLRSQDVSKILKETIPEPKQWDNLIEEGKP